MKTADLIVYCDGCIRRFPESRLMELGTDRVCPDCHAREEAKTMTDPILADEETCECQMCNDLHPESSINSEGMCSTCQAIYDAIEEATNAEAEAADELERCNRAFVEAQTALYAARRALTTARDERRRLERKHGKN